MHRDQLIIPQKSDRGVITRRFESEKIHNCYFSVIRFICFQVTKNHLFKVIILFEMVGDEGFEPSTPCL